MNKLKEFKQDIEDCLHSFYQVRYMEEIKATVTKMEYDYIKVEIQHIDSDIIYSIETYSTYDRGVTLVECKCDKKLIPASISMLEVRKILGIDLNGLNTILLELIESSYHNDSRRYARLINKLLLIYSEESEYKTFIKKLYMKSWNGIYVRYKKQADIIKQLITLLRLVDEGE